MRRTLALLLVVVFGCTGEGATSTTGPVTPTSSTTSQVSTSSTGLPTPIGCPSDAELLGSGQIARITQPTSDSRVLGLISRQVAAGCERFGFDFDTAQDAPATTPPSVTASFLDGNRVIRIDLGINRTVITDQLVETALVNRIFVVRSLQGQIFVDIHLKQSATARVSVSNSPARLLLEMSPAAGPIGPAPAVADRTVLITPGDGAAVDTAFEVTGYTRSPEGSVLIVATRGNQVVLEQSTSAADWVETWGEFTAEVSLDPGTVNLFVGEESLDDGSLEGVTLTLTVQ